MCLHRQEPMKAPGLPTDWVYGFERTRRDRIGLEAFNGLWIGPVHNRKRFRSVERALHQPNSLAFDSDAFYSFVGLQGAVDTKYIADLESEPVAAVSHFKGTRCGCCRNCVKLDCGECVVCRGEGSSYTSYLPEHPFCVQKVHLLLVRTGKIAFFAAVISRCLFFFL